MLHICLIPLGYIIEKRERGNPDWYKVNSFPTPQTEFSVPNLNEGKTYEFRVTAVNEGGPGKPSKPSNPITAKEQKCTFFNYFMYYKYIVHFTFNVHITG